MANIPVERKRKSNWLLWLLALLILALILWFVWSWLDTGDEAAVEPVVGREEPVAPAEPVVTVETDPIDQAVLLAAADPAVHVGRQVRLTGLQVQQVFGDVTFTVSTPTIRAAPWWSSSRPPVPAYPASRARSTSTPARR